MNMFKSVIFYTVIYVHFEGDFEGDSLIGYGVVIQK